jgi:hypothetical protein
MTAEPTPRRKEHAPQVSPLHAKIYLTRVLFSGMALAVLLAHDLACNAPGGLRVWLYLVVLVYPHIGHAILGRFTLQRRGNVLLLLDGLLVGVILGAMNIPLLPGIALVSIIVFNWIILGGLRLLIIGLPVLIVGMLSMVPDVAQSGTWLSSCPTADWLAGSILMLYLMTIAYIIHQRINEFSEHHEQLRTTTDSAENVRILAEQTLYAALTPSAVDLLRTTSEERSRHIPDAALMLINLQPQDRQAFRTQELAMTVRSCDKILSRHGLEIVKTFGGRILCFSSGINGAQDALAATRELLAFFDDHPDQKNTRVQVILHTGPTTLAMICLERLNVDLAGTTVAELVELAELAHASRSQLVQNVLATAAFVRRSSQPEAFVTVSTPTERNDVLYALKTSDVAN